MTQAVPTEVGGHAVRVEDVPDPQVSERASRRTYTARYKLDVLAEYERLDKARKGALATTPARGSVDQQATPD